MHRQRFLLPIRTVANLELASISIMTMGDRTMRHVTLLLTALTLLLVDAGRGRAGTVTLDFPSSDSTTFSDITGLGTLGSGGGGVEFQAGDYVLQSFDGTGLATATSSHWVFDMSDFTLPGVDNTFEVLINSTVVGAFDFIGQSGGDSHHFDLTFGPTAPILGGNYTLEILATSTVPSDNGSWNWLPGGQVTLTSNAVPEPSSLALFSVAGAIFSGYSRWRRRT
jgi:hypothetical protein